MKYVQPTNLLHVFKLLLNNILSKVDKVSGKQLSTEDYTTEEKTKLAGIADGAQVNVLENITVNGTKQSKTDKTVALTIPLKLSDLPDDLGFLKESDLQPKLNALKFIRLSYVTVLPDPGEEGTLYLVPEVTGEDGNVFAEFVYIADTNRYELLGASKVDLSGVWAKTELVAATYDEAKAVLQTYAGAEPELPDGGGVNR